MWQMIIPCFQEAWPGGGNQCRELEVCVEREKYLVRRQNPKVDELEIIMKWARVNVLTLNIYMLNCIFHLKLSLFTFIG